MPRSFVLVGGPALVPPRAIKPVTTSLCMAGNEELTHYSLSWWARCVQNLFAIQCPGTASVVGHSPTCCASAVPHHECIVPCGNPVIMHPMPLQHRAATPIEAWSGSGLQRPSRWVSAFAPNMPCVLMRALAAGVGKGMWIQTMGKILSPYYVCLSSHKQLLSNFNSHIANKTLIFL